ncbi:uncharacterized protein [Dermacentor andersoni]|uniref:uncharacterized protein n=1 Tax=Dermacentor andersoni TaxID=34620 RepID=UPI003B3BC341
MPKSRASSRASSADSADVQCGADIVDTQQQFPQCMDASDPQPSTSRADVSDPRRRTSGADDSDPRPSTSGADDSDPRPSTSGADDSDPRPSTSGADDSDPRPSTSGADVSDPGPSTSRADDSDPRPSTSPADDSDPRPSTSRVDETQSRFGSTIQAHLEPHYISIEASRGRAETVQASLSSVSATERKMKLTGERGSCANVELADEFLVVQVTALNALYKNALCQECSQPGLTVHLGTRHGLAARMLLTCNACGVVASEWSSPRVEGGKAFDVNMRAMQAIKTTGRGATALTDFWSVMNVSYRGLHHKTFQRHLKSKFRPAGGMAAASLFSDAVAAVRKVYSEMDLAFTKNVTVVYDGTWMTRGHASHIGVGTIIEFYTGLVLDCVVLSNRCHGCTLGPKENDEGYSEWKENHVCQKNTDANSSRMEVEAALILFRRSLERNDLRYTCVVCDGDSRTFQALCEDKAYGFITFNKEDCINHVKKRMGTALRTLVSKSRRSKPIGGKGGLTQDLIKKLTNYYGMAIRNNSEVDDMQRAIMATFYHITSTDKDPHHELCPPGPLSWCRHQAAEAEGKAPPEHKYKLATHVSAALLPVYQRLSDPQLLSRCQGKKTQNAAESLHAVIWSILPKEQNASLIAAETAVNEAVCKYNAGTLRAYRQFCASLGLKPGKHSLQRAAEKDALRKKKASKKHQMKGHMPKKPRCAKDTKDYNPGAF